MAATAEILAAQSLNALPISFFEGLWEKIKNALREEIGDAAFRSWIMPLRVDGFNRGALRLAAPTRFIRDWIATHYADRLRVLWHNSEPSVLQIDVVAIAQADAATSEQIISSTPLSTSKSSAANDDGDDAGQFSYDKMSITLDPRLTFDNFVVGKPNELAFAAAQRIAESSTVSFNPLFLYGGVGLGKTHLMHAIASRIKEINPNRRVLYISAEKFMYQFVRALRFKNIVAFKEQFRNVNVLMIDDVQFISGKDSTQEEFFHTFNALVDQNHQIIISADKSPSDLEGMEERLKSRLGWGLVADIHPTTYELRLSILQNKIATMGVSVPDSVVEYLASKITSNVRELEGALNRVAYHASLSGAPINLEVTQNVLRDQIRAHERKTTIEDIQKKVAEHFTVRMSDMHSNKRTRTIARPRQIAMYLSKALTSFSYPEIGRKFGGRDHTTVLHASRTIEKLMQEDSTLAEDVRLLRKMLEA